MEYIFIILILFFIIYVISNLCKYTMEGLVVGGDDCPYKIPISSSENLNICADKCDGSPEPPPPEPPPPEPPPPATECNTFTEDGEEHCIVSSELLCTSIALTKPYCKIYN